MKRKERNNRRKETRVKCDTLQEKEGRNYRKENEEKEQKEKTKKTEKSLKP